MPTIDREISHEKFEALESMLRGNGIIEDDEWFCGEGATFIAGGVPVHIRPVAFNGTRWRIEIKTLNPAAN